MHVEVWKVTRLCLEWVSSKSTLNVGIVRIRKIKLKTGKWCIRFKSATLCVTFVSLENLKHIKEHWIVVNILVFTHDDRFPLEVDVADAHHLVGRKGNTTTTVSLDDANLNQS